MNQSPSNSDQMFNGIRVGAGVSHEQVIAKGEDHRLALEQAHASWRNSLKRYHRRSIIVHAIAYCIALLVMSAGSGQVTLMTIPAGLLIGGGLTWAMLWFQVPVLVGGFAWGAPAIVAALVLWGIGWWTPASASGLFAIGPLMVQVCVSFGWIIQGILIAWRDDIWHRDHSSLTITPAATR